MRGSAPPRMKVHGMLLLDKPLGLSSNAALQRARRLFRADKAGHGGTLDPMASGLLPVLFGEACKLADTHLQGDKAYDAIVRLGVTTSTDDREGEVLHSAASGEVPAGRDPIDAVLDRFRGSIEQRPPIFSALKVKGRAAYDYARAGESIEIAPRTVTIHELRVERYEAPDLHLHVRCSKGTYIRALARDIGSALGCGAHLHGLRRVQTGRLDIGRAVTLEELERLAEDARSERLVPIESLVQDRDNYAIDAQQASAFRQGQAVDIDASTRSPASHFSRVAPPEPADGGAPATVAVLLEGRLLGLARPESLRGGLLRLHPSRVIVH